jgi:hypothetical protein
LRFSVIAGRVVHHKFPDGLHKIDGTFNNSEKMLLLKLFQAYGGTTETSRLAASLTPTKRSTECDSSRKLMSVSSSSHSLSGIPELGGFGVRVPLSSTAVPAAPATSQQSNGRMSAKQRSRSGEIRAPIATSEELSPLTPLSQGLSQSGDLMLLTPDAKYMANQSLGPTMSGLLAGSVRKDCSFSDEKKELLAGNSDSFGDTSFSAASTGRSRHPRTAPQVAQPQVVQPSAPTRAPGSSQSQSTGRSTPSTLKDDQQKLLPPASGAVKRPASFARAVNSDAVSSSDSSRRDRVGASQAPALDTQHEESAASSILEISV